MRRILLTTAAAAAMASPALAEPPLSYGGPPNSDSSFYSNVVGGLRVGIYRVFPSEDEKNFSVFQGAGHANVHLGSTWNLLFETGGNAAFEDGESESGVYANAHLWKGAGNFRWGVYGGVNFSEATFGKLGIEAEYDVTSRITVGAQASYGFASPEDFDINVVGLRGWWDYYITENTKFTGEVAYYNIDDDYDSVDLWDFKKKLAYRFPGTPYNVFAQADYYTSEGDHAWALGIGASINLDHNGTQKAYDRTYVPFDDDWGGPVLLGINY